MATLSEEENLDRETVMMEVKTELMDDDEDRSAAAANNEDEKNSDNNDNDDINEDDEQSDKNVCAISRAGDVDLDAAAAAAEFIKKEKKSEQILDLSRVADDDTDDSTDGIR